MLSLSKLCCIMPLVKQTYIIRYEGQTFSFVSFYFILNHACAVLNFCKWLYDSGGELKNADWFYQSRLCGDCPQTPPVLRKPGTVDRLFKSTYWLTIVFFDVPLVEFIYLIFIRIPCKNDCRRLRSLLLCLCDIFHALINSLVSCSSLISNCTDTLFVSLQKIKWSSLAAQVVNNFCVGWPCLYFLLLKKACFFFFSFFLFFFFAFFLCPVQFHFSFLYIINFHYFLFFLPKCS